MKIVREEEDGTEGYGVKERKRYESLRRICPSLGVKAGQIQSRDLG